MLYCWKSSRFFAVAIVTGARISASSRFRPSKGPRESSVAHARRVAVRTLNVPVSILAMCVPTIFGADKDCLSRCRAGVLLIGLSLRGMTRVRVVVPLQ